MIIRICQYKNNKNKTFLFKLKIFIKPRKNITFSINRNRFIKNNSETHYNNQEINNIWKPRQIFVTRTINNISIKYMNINH